MPPARPDALKDASSLWSPVIDALGGRSLLVVGDVMLDEYVFGDIRRTSPEAPVPVVEVTDRHSALGGAANAAANAASLGGRLVLGGVMGEDPTAADLVRALQARGIASAGLVAVPGRPTTSKLRVLARGQQVIRVDTESTMALPPGPADRLAGWAERALATADAVLLSDYGKGVISPTLAGRVITAARLAGRPVVLDPKGPSPGRYRGATVVKPNLTELADLTARPVRTTAEMLAAGRWLAEELTGSTILVTRGPDGMALFRAGQPALGLPAAPSRQVFDVTGAGDTVAATLVLSLAAGLPLETACRLANAAAGVVVQKVGTAVVTPAELRATLAEGIPDFMPLRE